MDTDDDLTDDHMRLLAWLSTHPTGSLAAAAQVLNLAIADVEVRMAYSPNSDVRPSYCRLLQPWSRS